MAAHVTRARQREFWRLVVSGMSVEDAGAAVGASATSARRWFREAGGMPPLSLQEPARPRALTIAEREEIRSGMDQGLTYRQIAERIGRHHTTVWREIDRNTIHQRYSSATDRRRRLGRRARPPWRYSPHGAQLRADKQLARPKPAKLAVNDRLRAIVQDRLEQEHSPEQIAAVLRREFEHEPEMWVSPETIYQSLYVQGRGALRRDLHKRLRTGRALRKPRRRPGERRGRIPGMVNISERPPEVEDRAVPGHWEGDLIMGSTASNSAIGTLVERASRYVILLHLPDGHGADAIQEAMVAAMSRLPEQLRKTLTWDQGKEMSNHVQIAEACDLDIYFCDPHSPWQRGSNENTNGLLRQYFPKSTDLSAYQADYLEHVARKLNTRPRETLDWQTPAVVLDRLLSQPLNPPGVALTG